MMDEKLQPINNRLDKIEDRLDKIEDRLEVLELLQKCTAKKLDDLQLDVKIAERDIRRDIHDLDDEMETEYLIKDARSIELSRDFAFFNSWRIQVWEKPNKI